MTTTTTTAELYTADELAAYVRRHEDDLRAHECYEVETVHYVAELDNREPWHRLHEDAYVLATFYAQMVTPPSGARATDPYEVRGVSIMGADAFGRGWQSAMYLIDRGAATIPYYVACYRDPMVHAHPWEQSIPHPAHLILHPIGGHPRGWSMGPRKAFHLTERAS